MTMMRPPYPPPVRNDQRGIPTQRSTDEQHRLRLEWAARVRPPRPQTD